MAAYSRREFFTQFLDDLISADSRNSKKKRQQKKPKIIEKPTKDYEIKDNEKPTEPKKQHNPIPVYGRTMYANNSLLDYLADKFAPYAAGASVAAGTFKDSEGTRRGFLKSIGAFLIGKEAAELVRPKSVSAGGLSELEQLIEKADKSFQADNYSEAVSLYQKAINVNAKAENKLDKQKAAEIYFKLGLSYGELKQWDRGSEAYTRGMVFRPQIKVITPDYESKKSENLSDEGIRNRKGNKKKSIELLNEVERLEPNHPGPNYFKGWTYYYDNNPEASISEFKKAINKDTLFALPYAGIGKQFFELNKPKEAIFYYNVYLTLNPNTSSAPIIRERIQKMKELL